MPDDILESLMNKPEKKPKAASLSSAVLGTSAKAVHMLENRNTAERTTLNNFLSIKKSPFLM